MNLLFEEKIQYELTEPIENVRSQLESIIGSPGHSFSNNLSGTVTEDNSFRVYPKFPFIFNVFGIPQEIAILKGQLRDDGDRTRINTVVRAKYSLVAAFYLIVFFFVTALMEVSASRSAEPWVKSLMFFLILSFIFGLIRLSIQRLRRRFEQQMHIRASN